MLKAIVGLGALWIGVAIAAVIGWIMNIVQLFGMDADFNNTRFLIKLVGIFIAPLGAVLGYL